MFVGGSALSAELLYLLGAFVSFHVSVLDELFVLGSYAL